MLCHVIAYNQQVLQLPPAHPEHLEDEPPEDSLDLPLPPERCEKADISFSRSSLSHLGQIGLSLPITSVSNSSPQDRHLKSYKGIF